MTDLAALKQRIIEGDREAAVTLTRAAIGAGCTPDAIFTEALCPAMDRVGHLMQEHEYFIPDVLVSARAMQACSALLRPLVVRGAGMRPIGKAVACTVAGDLHDIGKNLVCLLLEGTGFTIVDLGSNCPSERVVEAVRQHQPDVLVMSAMLTTTMLNMRGVIELLRLAGLREHVHVMIGGAPVNSEFAREIGADFYGAHAVSASTHARAHLETRRTGVAAAEALPSGSA